MIVLFLAALVLSVGGKSLQKRDWKPIIQPTGGKSGYVGAEYTSKNKNWHLGGALHGDLNKPGIVDGGRIQGGYQFKNGVKLDGYFQGHDKGNVEGGIEGGYRFKNGVELNGHLQGNSKGKIEAGLGVKIPLGKGKRSVSCVTVCYEECKQDTDCLERCMLTFC